MGKIHVITNGFDEADFINLGGTDPEKLTLTYVGTLSEIYPVDNLIKVLQQFKILKKEFLLRFVGTVPESIKLKIVSALAENSYEFIPYVKHEEAVRYMMSSSALVLIIPRHASNKSIITGKLFEYIATGKPVICIGPVNGDAAEIVLRSQAGVTFDYDDYQGLLKFAETLRIIPEVRNPEHINIFTRKNLASEISHILD